MATKSLCAPFLHLLLLLIWPSNSPAIETLPITYKQISARPLRIFLDKPTGWKPSDHRPAIVYFFGGGWVGGTPNQFIPQSQGLAERGAIGIRVEYRTIPPGDHGPPIVCCADAKSAMRYIRSHASELGIDPQRIAAAGGSAGGHLAAFTALVEGQDDPQDDLSVSCKPNALILYNPVCNNGPGQWGYDRLQTRFREFSPAHHLQKNAPPTVIFLGDQDQLIPVKTLQDFAKELEDLGTRCDLHLYPGAGHGFFNHNTPAHPWLTDTLRETDRFLTSLGWLIAPTPPSPPTPLNSQK